MLGGLGQRFFAACLALLALTASAQAREFVRPETFTLRNGLQVVVITDRRAPVVTHMVWYRVGAADEPRGYSGIAHFFEHLMFKGTRQIAPGEFSRTVARNGGEDNAFTNWDYTAYYERIARDRLELVMRMEADRMRNLQFSDETFASERDVIVEERRQRVDNNPGAVLGERMRAMLWPHHPYGTPVIGWLHEIQSLDRQTALQFYRTWYAPNNAILVVAGDVDAAELRPLADRYYGRLRPTRDLPARTWVTDPPNVGPMRVTHSDEKVRQPSFSRLYRAISYGVDTGRQAHALDVGMEILGGSETSRLYRALVEDQRIAVSAGASASSSGLGGGSASVWATPAEGVTLEQVEAAVDAVIAEFLRDGPTEDELTRAKNSLAANAIYSRDSQESLANIYGSSLAQGESIDDVVNWARDIEAVTRDEAVAMVRQTLDLNASVTGWLVPEQAQ
ncbi:M16 family metallopeptidase [Candidatus Viadribacter manganicus]|uniref:Zinc protease n=1 Tax=Candidatus Viadribacter manganicus TaxID=1759059 RepID=A0A1B1AFB5_9PROT|nr:pitrilysin family protein [Candidatus Viadribacter manganicus]ANP45266.1 zinc protease [Candidatus Viadribacter manganicus]